METRIGIGYDIHRLVEGRKLYLGGIEIPYVKGLYGYSDGDVLLHAICDSMLGALGLGDIGIHFPNTDPKYQGISSLELLKKTNGLINAKKYEIINIDSTIIADNPIMGPFKSDMSKKIASCLDIDKNLVNIKATTQEGVGLFSKSDAICAYAICLLKNTGKK